MLMCPCQHMKHATLACTLGVVSHLLALFQVSSPTLGHARQAASLQALVSAQSASVDYMKCFAPTGAFVAVMTVFAAVCMAETRGVPLEAMRELWRAHWFWRGALTLTGAGRGNPQEASGLAAPAVSACHGSEPQKGLDGGLDGANGLSSVKRPLMQARLDGADGQPLSRGVDNEQATTDKV